MRKILISALCIILSIYSYGQIELKGIKLGEYGKDVKFETTMGGIKGWVFGKTFQNKTYEIIFVCLPADNFRPEITYYDSDIENFMNGLEKKYNFKSIFGSAVCIYIQLFIW